MFYDYYNAADPESIVKCPYNREHVMKAKNLQKHMIKCKMTWPRDDLKPCPYNACHEIPINYFQTHLMECPDRALVDQDSTMIGHVKTEQVSGGNCSLPTYKLDRFNWSDEESWDDDGDTPSSSRTYQELPQPRTMSKLVKNRQTSTSTTSARMNYPQPTQRDIGTNSSSDNRPAPTSRQLSSEFYQKPPSREQIEYNIQKRLDDLPKRLREIEAIEEKQGNGGRLNPQEIFILSQRDDVVRKMECLGLR